MPVTGCRQASPSCFFSEPFDVIVGGYPVRSEFASLSGSQSFHLGAVVPSEVNEWLAPRPMHHGLHSMGHD
jgi:hypothetical protein